MMNMKFRVVSVLHSTNNHCDPILFAEWNILCLLQDFNFRIIAYAKNPDVAGIDQPGVLSFVGKLFKDTLGG
jgi:hypothetical protein